MKFPNILKDALFNTVLEKSKSEVQYAKGIVVGIMACLMAQGHSFDEAMFILANYLPSDYNPETIPTSWKGKEV